MKAEDLTTIIQAVVQGDVDIAFVWQQYGEEIENGITDVSTTEHVYAIIAAYLRYDYFLSKEGYSRKALYYAERANNLLDSFKVLLNKKDWKQLKETTLNALASAYANVKDFRHGYSCLKELCILNPEKDFYKSERNDCFSSMVLRCLWPVYIVIIVIWLFMALQKWVLHVHILPNILWHITWWIWIVALLVQFLLPWIVNKMRR